MLDRYIWPMYVRTAMLGLRCKQILGIFTVQCKEKNSKKGWESHRGVLCRQSTAKQSTREIQSPTEKLNSAKLIEVYRKQTGVTLLVKCSICHPGLLWDCRNYRCVKSARTAEGTAYLRELSTPIFVWNKPAVNLLRSTGLMNGEILPGLIRKQFFWFIGMIVLLFWIETTRAVST